MRWLDPGAKIGPYTIVRLVGFGAHASVYECIYNKQQIFALKLFETRELFQKELHVMRPLRHANIMPVVYANKRQWAIVLPFAEQSLADVLETSLDNRLPLQSISLVFSPIFSALIYLHEEKGLIHQDIRPANILFSSGNIFLSDFGRTITIGSRPERVADPQYMAPEQASRLLFTQSDQYSLAVVITQSLLGTSQQQIDTLPIPTNSKQALKRALSENPFHRYIHIADFRDEFLW